MDHEESGSAISREMIRELGLAPALVTEDEYASALRARLRGIGDEAYPREARPTADREHRDELVRERAYAIWEREGRPDGRELDNWLEAERELRGDADAPS